MRCRTARLLVVLSLPAAGCHPRQPAAALPVLRAAGLQPASPAAGPQAPDWTIILDPGHGGDDPGTSWHGTSRLGQPGTYREAAYTYPIAREAARQLRDLGFQVIPTAEAAPHDDSGGFDDELPLPAPTDAVFTWDSRPVRGGHPGLAQRTAWAQKLWPRFQATAPEHLIFLAIHIDEVPHGGRRGAHVCIDSRTPKPPRLAAFLARRLTPASMERLSEGKNEVLIDRHHLYVLNPQHNPIPERLLVEVAAPEASGEDFTRVCSEQGRRQLVAALCQGLEDFRRATP